MSAAVAEEAPADGSAAGRDALGARGAGFAGWLSSCTRTFSAASGRLSVSVGPLRTGIFIYEAEDVFRWLSPGTSTGGNK